MSSEDISLLSAVDNGPNQLDDSDVYLRFSSTRKRIILAMVSVCTMINCMFHLFRNQPFTSYGWILDSLVEMFTPSIPQIAKDLNSTGPVVKWSTFEFRGPLTKKNLLCFFSIAVSMSVLASSLGALIVATYSTFCKFWILDLVESCFDSDGTATTFYRRTKTCLSIFLTCLCDWFRWRRFCTKHSFSTFLEVFPINRCFAWSGDWGSCHWRHL